MYRSTYCEWFDADGEWSYENVQTSAKASYGKGQEDQDDQPDQAPNRVSSSSSHLVFAVSSFKDDTLS